jgi:spore maturation protein CgeB
MKILILGKNGIARKNWGHQLFLNSFQRQHECIYWGNDHVNFDENLSIPEVIEKYGKPDLILTYLAKRCYPFKGLDKIDKDIKRVHIEIDFFNKTGKYKGQYDNNIKFNSYENFYKEFKPQIIFAPVSTVLNGLIDHKLCDKNYLLPFSVDIQTYKPMKEEKVIDVMAIFSNSSAAYPLRKSIQRMVQKLPNIKAVIRKVKHIDHVKAINQSKITITSNNLWNSLSMRYTEVLACGGFLLADRPEDFERLGYVDGKHLVLYKGLPDLKDKISYYLKHPELREKIGKEGFKLVVNNHTTDIRVKQFTDIVNRDLFGGKL